MQHTQVPSGYARKMASEYAPPASALPVPTSITGTIGSGSASTTLGTVQGLLPLSGKSTEATRMVVSETQIETPSTSGLYSSPQITEISLSSVSSATSTPHPSSPMITLRPWEAKEEKRLFLIVLRSLGFIGRTVIRTKICP